MPKKKKRQTPNAQSKLSLNQFASGSHKKEKEKKNLQVASVSIFKLNTCMVRIIYDKKSQITKNEKYNTWDLAKKKKEKGHLRKWELK